MSYQNILQEEYSKTRLFWNILQLLSDELKDYSKIIAENDPILAGKVIDLSKVNHEYSEELLDCWVNKNGVLDRLMDGGNLKEKGVIKKFMEKRKSVEDNYFEYVDDNPAVIEHAEIIKSIFNKYGYCISLIKD